MQDLDNIQKRVPLPRRGTLILSTLTVKHLDDFDELMVRGLVADSFRLLAGSVEKKVKIFDVVDLAFRSGKFYPDDLPGVFYQPGREWIQDNVTVDEAVEIMDAFMGCNGGLLAYLGKMQAFQRRVQTWAGPLVKAAPTPKKRPLKIFSGRLAG